MKLCFIANPNLIHTRRWLTYFSRCGFTVHLIAEHQPEKPFPEVTLHDLTAIANVRKLRYLLWAIIVRRLVQRLNPDVLHAHQVTSAGWLGLAANHHPFVVTPWGTDIYQHPRRSQMASWLASRVLRAADLVTADSADLLDQAVRLGADPQRGHLIQWGVDLDVFSPVDNRDAVRKRLGLGKGPIILSPRAMRPLYRHETTLAAIPAVRRVFPDALFVFRDFRPDPPDYASQLMERARSLHIADAVQFIEPTDRYEDMADLYRAADVVVSIPLSDGTPVSVLEAFACGTPVVATDLPSLQEWITPEMSGLMVPVNDQQALADALVRLLKDDRLYRRVQNGALQVARERADHEQWMSRMKDLYIELAQCRVPASPK